MATKKPAGMSIDEFWTIVEEAGEADDGEDGAADALRELLAKRSAPDLAAFAGHFEALHARAYRWDLWGAAYLIGGGCSDDGFDYFRNALVMKGRAVYEAALAKPDSLAKVDIGEDEGVAYVARELYEAKTKEPLAYSVVDAPDEPLGEEWDFDDEAENKRRLPQLTKLASAN
jgi:hypothetical protein